MYIYIYYVCICKILHIYITVDDIYICVFVCKGGITGKRMYLDQEAKQQEQLTRRTIDKTGFGI